MKDFIKINENDNVIVAIKNLQRERKSQSMEKNSG